jgi:hypothetical protein
MSRVASAIACPFASATADRLARRGCAGAGTAYRPGQAGPRPAEGARPAPAERLYQVFKVDNGEVTEIRGYRDRASALARP